MRAALPALTRSGNSVFKQPLHMPPPPPPVLPGSAGRITSHSTRETQSGKQTRFLHLESKHVLEPAGEGKGREAQAWFGKWVGLMRKESNVDCVKQGDINLSRLSCVILVVLLVSPRLGALCLEFSGSSF